MAIIIEYKSFLVYNNYIVRKYKKGGKFGMEYAVQSNVIRGLTKEEHRILTGLCQYSNNLYNVALYNIRQYFFNQKKFLTYESN